MGERVTRLYFDLRSELYRLLIKLFDNIILECTMRQQKIYLIWTQDKVFLYYFQNKNNKLGEMIRYVKL